MELKMVWALAIWRGSTEAAACRPVSPSTGNGEMETTNPAKGPIKGKKIITPTTLKSTCTMDTRSASRGLPIEAKKDLTQVPIITPTPKKIIPNPLTM